MCIIPCLMMKRMKHQKKSQKVNLEECLKLQDYCHIFQKYKKQQQCLKAIHLLVLLEL